MLPRLAPGACAAVFLHLAFPAAAAAQQCLRSFGPENGEFRFSQSTSYDQIWPQVARGPNGWTCVWSQGQDVWARVYDLDMNAVTAQFQVNTFFQTGIQDEPAVCQATSGNVLVSWSERQGYDGSAMGVFARVYGPDGTPLTGEFVVNSNTFASQWRPLIAPTPAGGWVVAWSGDSDGNAYFRILNPTGGFLSGDVLINTFTVDAQVDPAVAVAPSGTIFAVYVDYSGHAGTAAGLELYGRTFTSAGVPVQPAEFLIRTMPASGHQKDPRVAADGLGRFFVTWEDQVGDGAGYGIFARAFNSAGAPLAPAFQVNSTTASDQRQARIAIDAFGRSIMTWVDFSAGFANAKIRARRFNGQGTPVAPDFVVNENPSIGTSLACPAVDANGTDFLIGFQGPGAPGEGLDVYAKRYTWTAGPNVYCAPKVNSLGCTPAVGASGSASASSASPFLITATQVLNQKPALLLYGFDSSFLPYSGATICITPPLKRTVFYNTGGNANPVDCSGNLSMDFNARIQSGVDAALIPGTTVGARWYYRDSQDPTGFGTGLTDAVRFTICP